MLFMFVDRTPGTIVIRTGIHDPIIKRRVSPNRRTARKQNLCLFVCLLLVHGVGTRLRNIASREVMSGNRLCIPGTNVSTPSQPLISVETASIRRPKTGSSSHQWFTGHETGPRVVESAKATSVLMRLIFPVIAACLFGCLSRRPGDLDYVDKRKCCNAY